VLSLDTTLRRGSLLPIPADCRDLTLILALAFCGAACFVQEFFHCMQEYSEYNH
jgi:hypothetical protein